MSRSSCPPNLEKKLKREVGNRCPFCGGFPLVCAHTTKTYNEVGWNYDYLLAICGECEKKVEGSQLERSKLQDKKNNIKTSISIKERNTPRQIQNNKTIDVYLGETLSKSTNIVIQYKTTNIIWYDFEGDIPLLSARFYDKKGTVVTAIDKNMWTADRERFYEFKSTKINDAQHITITSKKDDTNISMTVTPTFTKINSSTFYIPGQKIHIDQEGNIVIGSNIISGCSIDGCGVAIHLN